MTIRSMGDWMLQRLVPQRHAAAIWYRTECWVENCSWLRWKECCRVCEEDGYCFTDCEKCHY